MSTTIFVFTLVCFIISLVCFILAGGDDND